MFYGSLCFTLCDKEGCKILWLMRPSSCRDQLVDLNFDCRFSSYTEVLGGHWGEIFSVAYLLEPIHVVVPWIPHQEL